MLTVETDIATPVWAVCTDDSDPDERHLVESADVSTAHMLRLQGLAPERTYTCTVRTECGLAEPVLASHSTPAMPGDVSEFTVTHGDRETWGSYSLFPEIEPCKDYEDANTHVLVVDSEGVVRWLYELPDAIVSSDLDVRYLGEGRIHIAGGWGQFDLAAPHRGMFRTLDLSSEVVHHRDEPTVGMGFNHHSERLDTGEFLTLTYALHGFTVGITVEVWDPVTDTVTWSWDTQDTLNGDRGPDQRGVVFWAANSVSFVDDALGSAMYLSVVTTDTIWRVDRTSGLVTHIIGAGQGWSLLDAAGNVLGKEDWFYFQHDPEFTADGRVLLHDNGQGRPGENYTRVVEFAVDLEAKTLTEVWSWTEDGWYNPYLGDADRLPNDNVFVGTGFVWCVSGRNGYSSLIEIEPVSGELAWRLDWDNSDFTIYRAEKLDGCEIFRNAKYCDAVAERIDALESGAVVPGG